ncbi:hypothetical protein WMQ67_09830 [Vibrio harveyi]|uniref:hypothetical protein n=1 Tax=Vibrio harveyi TaxID=669 RepID=UPI002893A52D|nr:putative Uncharacterized phage protein [Vibrio harveyi]
MVRFSEVPEDTKYWFVRAGNNGGKYFYHFKDNNIVGLGHADDVGLDFENLQRLTDENIATVIGSTRNYLNNHGDSPSQISNKTNQINRFLMNMSIGDIVLTVNDGFLMAGRITSQAYYGTLGLALATERDSSVPTYCSFELRRNITWGRPKPRGLMPIELEKAFRYTGSIMQLTTDEQIKAINHWLFPVHFHGDEVRCTLRISSLNSLSNRKLTKLSSFLDDVELMSDYVERALMNQEDINIRQLLRFMEDNADSFDYALKAQHLFMSPGHQYIQLEGGRLKGFIYAALLVGLLSSEAVAIENVPPELARLNSPEIQQVINDFREEIDVGSLQDSLIVNLSTPSLQEEVEVPVAADEAESGWGTVDSDDTAL